MYTEYFGLKERPFDLTPDPSLLYLNQAYNEALAVLSYGVSARKGFISLVGEAGTGKTTVLRRFVADLGEGVKSVFVFNPSVGFEEMLAFVLDELEVEVPGGAGKLELLQALNEFLLAELNKGGNVVVLIDEAQDLRPEVLEELRLLSNLETEKEKILQIVFAGQPEFEERLRDASLRQLRQRIALRARLSPLTRGETAQYVRARLQAAGAGDASIFTGAALSGIWRASKGIPRLVNVVCDSSMVVAYAGAKKRVTSAVVREALADMAEPAVRERRRSAKTILGRAVLAAGLASVIGLGAWAIPGRVPQVTHLARRTARWADARLLPSGLRAQVGGKALVDRYTAARAGSSTGDERVPAPAPGPGSVREGEAPAPEEAASEEELAAAIGGAAGEEESAGEESQAVETLAESTELGATLPGEERVAGAVEEQAGELVNAPAVEPIEARPVEVSQPVAPEREQEEGQAIAQEENPAQPGGSPSVNPGEVVPVRPGDTLTELAAKRYGRVSFTLLDAIKNANPAIGDIDLIWAGHNLVLPPVDGALKIRQEEDGTYAAWVVSAGSLQIAQGYVRELADMGFAGRISLVSTDAGPRTRFLRIWLAGFDSADEADEAANRLRSQLENRIIR